MNAKTDDQTAAGKWCAGLTVAVVLSLLLWLPIQFNQSINADNASLMIALGRILSGGTMATDFYDPNPPLCMAIYIVPVLLNKFLHVPLYHALFFWTLAAIALSSWAIRLAASAAGAFECAEIHLLLAAYILCNTVLVGQFLGEREQFIILGLFPFALVQYAITSGWVLPRFATPFILAGGAIAALIKPHYCLIPAALLLHRIIRRRSLRVILDADALALITAAIVYALLIAMVFPDYVRTILPDVVSLYAFTRKSIVLPVGTCLALFCLILAGCVKLTPGRQGPATTLLFIMAALAIVPFIVQGRGYFYHAIPTLVFFSTGVMLLAYQGLKPLAGKAAAALPILLFLAFAAASYAYLPPNPRYATHDTFRHSVFAKLIRECGASCPFFLFDDMLEIIQPLSVYTGQTHASRFPSYWFLPPLIRAQDALDHGRAARFSKAQLAALREKYAAMVAADFRKYNPELVIVGQFNILENAPPFDFPAWFSSDPAFAREWRRYRFVKDISVNRGDLLGGTIYALKDNGVTYKIYRKKSD